MCFLHISKDIKEVQGLALNLGLDPKLFGGTHGQALSWSLLVIQNPNWKASTMAMLSASLSTISSKQGNL